MNSETRICQNCKNPFTIEPDDFAFYEKMKVPPPMFCPACRLQRRFAFANITNLYKRKCDLCGKEVVSRYSVDKRYTVYCPHCWWSDKWDPMAYGRDYDFSRPFFEQFNELWHEVPLLGLSIDLPTAIESPYVNDAGYLKQCYLLFTANYSERCFFGYMLTHDTDCANSSFINSCELGHDLFHCFKTYHAVHAYYTTQSSNMAFTWQCVNAQDCFMSANLHNKQYVIRNVAMTREAYQEEMKKYDLGSYRVYTDLKKEWADYRLKFPVKTFWHEFSTDTSGLFVFQSKNCHKCFEVTGGENCKYVVGAFTPTTKDCYDYAYWGDGAELLYECMIVGEKTRRVFFGEESGLGLYDSQYVKLCTGGSNIFGSVSIKGKSFCIFNKQYSKEAYEALVPKIIQHMSEMPYRDAKGRTYGYGEFFPIELSPFAYNETLAMHPFPLARTEAETEGYVWKDSEASPHVITRNARDLPDHIRDTGDDILRDVIGCARCGKGFRIIPQELAFYRKMNVPLARECPACRIEEKMREQPHPMKLWRRSCQCAGAHSQNSVYANQSAHAHGAARCVNEFETSYAPDRPEIVYCEQCYQQEIL